jgi:hypothetical protein
VAGPLGLDEQRGQDVEEAGGGGDAEDAEGGEQPEGEGDGGEQRAGVVGDEHLVAGAVGALGADGHEEGQLVAGEQADDDDEAVVGGVDRELEGRRGEGDAEGVAGGVGGGVDSEDGDRGGGADDGEQQLHVHEQRGVVGGLAAAEQEGAQAERGEVEADGEVVAEVGVAHGRGERLCEQQLVDHAAECDHQRDGGEDTGVGEARWGGHGSGGLAAARVWRVVNGGAERKVTSSGYQRPRRECQGPLRARPGPLGGLPTAANSQKTRWIAPWHLSRMRHNRHQARYRQP